MKILFYIHSMAGGGAERVFLNLMNYTDSKGHEVTLVLNQKEGSYIELISEGIEIIELGRNRPIEAAMQLKKFFKENNEFDVAFSTLTQCNYALIIAKLISSTKFKIAVREANSFLNQRGHLSKIRLIYERLKAIVLYRFADVIMVNSEGSMNELSEAALLGKQHINMLPNPLDRENIRVKALKEPPGQVLSFLNGRPYIVGAGRLEKAKGFDTLISSFNRFQKSNYCLLIMGEGGERETLQRLIIESGLEKRVLLAGHVENPYPVMSGGDLFVLSSRYEGMPNVLLEAMALGLPIVATDCPSGPSELLRNGRFGKLVPVDDESALSTAMSKQVEAGDFDQGEREDYLKTFDIEVVGNKFLNMLKS